MDSFDAVVRQAGVIIDHADPVTAVPWLFARCWVSVTRFAEHGRDVADFDRALADFDRLPDHVPGRAKLASILAVELMRGRLLDDERRVPTVRRLVDIAGADPEPLPDWPVNHAALRCRVIMSEAMLGAPGFQPRAGLAEIRRHAETVGDTQPQAAMVAMADATVTIMIARNEGGGERVLAEAIDRVSAVASQVPDGERYRPGLAMFRAMTDVAMSVERHDFAAAAARMAELADEAARLPPDDPSRRAFDALRDRLQAFLPLLRSAGPSFAHPIDPATEEDIARLRTEAQRPTPDPDRAMALATLATAEMTSDDAATVDDAVRHAGEAIGLASADDPRQQYYQCLLGVALMRRWEATGSDADLPAAIVALERARAVDGTHGQAFWTMAALPLAHAYRSSGRLALGRQTAISGLRGHAWNVLVRSTVPDRHAAAMDAASDATQVAWWCLVDDDLPAAVRALESGRCLIIHSALEHRDVDTRLRVHGADDLADRWRAAVAVDGPDAVPPDLRRAVIGTLAGIPMDAHGTMTAAPADATTRLLDPPELDEIRAALRTLDADALVYLVPNDHAGAAVVLPAAGDPNWLMLPGLTTPAVRRCVDRLAVVTSGDRDGPAAMAEVRAWAWDTAIGPLLTEHLDMPADRPVRLVLVPMGDLTAVPWHAASHDGGYAMARAVFSYAPSARLLCESAGPPVPLCGHGMVVGDPDTGRHPDLPAARSEALAIRSRFYPHAHYVGRNAAGDTAPDGGGTVAELLGWLTDPHGGPMLHLACHAIVHRAADADRTAALRLAGGRELAAEELIGTLTRTPGRDLGLVVLAACESGVSARGADEAFSLATAFLANGARSVLSARWRVPDEPTSVLMFLFHHYVRERGMRPADALRAAQLWMVGDEPPPTALPDELLVDRADPRSSLAWAGFIHFGR